MDSGLVLVGKVVGVHGVYGNIKIKPFAENFLDYVGSFLDDKSLKLNIVINSVGGKLLIANIVGDNNREVATKRIGGSIFVKRDILANSILYCDVENAKVFLQDNNLCGFVKKVHNFGSCDIIEVFLYSKKDTVFIPFIESAVIDFCNETKKIIINSLFID